MKKQKRTPSIKTRLWHLIRYKWHYLVPVLLMLLTLPLFMRANNRTDVLVYMTYDAYGEESSLMSYNPNTGETTTLLTERGLGSFNLSRDGRLAYSSRHEGNTEIYVRENLSPNSPSINITQNPDTHDYIGAWSPDGRYLAFYTYQNNEPRRIYVWDGEQTLDVTPTNMPDNAEVYSDIAWSFDGRLVFTVIYSVTNSGTPSEIYLWDGNTTTNLSQNRFGTDRFPRWNSDGQIAFFSTQDGIYNILVWDGVSMENGSPDISTFTNIPTELTAHSTYYPFPTWTNNNQLAIMTTASQDSYTQIYVWDGETATNISQNPDLRNGRPRWTADGRWAFATFFPSPQLLYVRDTENNIIFETEGQSPAWSSDGNLMFCTYVGSDKWTLNLWDGQQTVEILSEYNIMAQWQSGERIFCSSS